MTAIAVLSLALGIGANTALFSILNSLILKSLPVRDPHELVLLGGNEWTNPIWEQIRAHERELADGAFAWSPDSFDLSRGGPTDPVNESFIIRFPEEHFSVIALSNSDRFNLAKLPLAITRIYLGDSVALPSKIGQTGQL